MLFNEPKLLKFFEFDIEDDDGQRFSALQRAEIAEIPELDAPLRVSRCFSALQRAEIAEIFDIDDCHTHTLPFQCSSTSRNC